MDETIFGAPEHSIFRDSFRKFVAREITPHTSEWEEAHAVPRSIWRRMGEEGYLCPWLPEEYGGLELGFEYSVIINEELLRGNAFGVGVSPCTAMLQPPISSLTARPRPKNAGCPAAPRATWSWPSA